MKTLSRHNPVLWLGLLLLAWLVLGAQVMEPKTASGPFYAASEHRLGVTRWEAAPRLALSAWTTDFASGDTVTPKGVTNPEVPKLGRPSIPEGMTQSQFGKDVVGWGARPEGALQRLETINVAEVASMQKQGLTRSMASEWKDFYANEFSRNKNNITAKNRVELMQKILDNWE
ncbi:MULTISPECIES: DUF4951 domain-containing protein [Pseudomonas]|uniref:DUF4951 domain-containing protein n=1 Tax=Pseudomonas TaxID=286 RepID=UPI0005FCC249|nr:MULTISPECIES: DUF4951 domain-containing protein [Pseudomonas]BAQ79491.1 putative uncharacterized protein [Pseudomonas sp. St29]